MNSHINVEQFTKIPFPILDSSHPKANGNHGQCEEKTKPKEEKCKYFFIKLGQIGGFE
jgi:hypothetical protein